MFRLLPQNCYSCLINILQNNNSDLPLFISEDRFWWSKIKHDSAITLLKTYQSTKQALIRTRRGEIDNGEHDMHGFAKSLFWIMTNSILIVMNHQKSILFRRISYFSRQRSGPNSKIKKSADPIGGGGKSWSLNRNRISAYRHQYDTIIQRWNWGVWGVRKGEERGEMRSVVFAQLGLWRGIFRWGHRRFCFGPLEIR